MTFGASLRGYLRWKPLSSPLTQADEHCSNTVIIQKYMNSERPTGCAFVEFDEIIDSHHALLRVDQRKTTVFGYKVACEVLLKDQSFSRNGYRRCGRDPLLSKYGRETESSMLRSKAALSSPSRMHRDAMGLDPELGTLATTAQRSSPIEYIDLTGDDPISLEPVIVLQPPLPEVQRDVKGQDQESQRLAGSTRPLLRIPHDASCGCNKSHADLPRPYSHYFQMIRDAL